MTSLRVIERTPTEALGERIARAMHPTATHHHYLEALEVGLEQLEVLRHDLAIDRALDNVPMFDWHVDDLPIISLTLDRVANGASDGARVGPPRSPAGSETRRGSATPTDNAGRWGSAQRSEGAAGSSAHPSGVASATGEPASLGRGCVAGSTTAGPGDEGQSLSLLEAPPRGPSSSHPSAPSSSGRTSAGGPSGPDPAAKPSFARRALGLLARLVPSSRS